MRIHILSDLHTEFAPYIPAPAADGADVVVLAGDIGLRTRGVEWARQAFRVPTFAASTVDGPMARSHLVSLPALTGSP